MTRFYRPAARKQLARLAALDALKMAYAQHPRPEYRNAFIEMRAEYFRLIE